MGLEKFNVDELPLKKVIMISGSFLLGLVLLYYFYILINNLFHNVHFKSMGELFEVDYYKFWKPLYSDSAKFNSGFGLRGDDYVDFEINVRTEGAHDDCKMKGIYKAGELHEIKIKGRGDNCSRLRENNKL